MPEDDLTFVGRMWVEGEGGEFYSKYPPLYPALAGILMRLFGDLAGFLVAPVSSWLAVLGMYVLCRALLPRWAAVVGAIVGCRQSAVQHVRGRTRCRTPRASPL